METHWLLNVSCCLLQTLLSLTTLNNFCLWSKKNYKYSIPNILFNFFVNSTANCIFLSDTTLSSNSCNFHMLSLNSLTNLSTIISSVVTIKCVILDNLLHTTKIVYFPATNGNFVIKFTVKCIHGLSSILFAINFPTSTSILLFILWHKSYSFTYFPIFFVTSGYQ